MSRLVESMAAANQPPPGCPLARAAWQAHSDIAMLAEIDEEAAAWYRGKLREAIAARDESRIASAGMNATFAMRRRSQPGA